MKGIFKKITLSVVLFTNVFSLNINCMSSDSSEGVQKTSVVELIKNDLEIFKGTNYFTAKEVLVPLSDKKAVNIYWGFGGSGDILKSFPALEIRVDDLKGDQDSSKESKFSWQKILALFFKKKIQNKVEVFSGSDLTNWFLKAKNSGLPTFVLKLFLLGNYDFEGQEIRQKVEMCRLLFRLLNSEIFTLFDHSKSLFSYLPEVVAETLKESVSSELLSFVDEMWNGIGNGFNEYEFNPDGSYKKENEGIKVNGFVFNNKVFAKECFVRSKTSGVISEDLMKNMVANKRSDDFYNKLFDLKDFADKKRTDRYKLVGYHNFGRITNNTKASEDFSENYLPEKIKEKVLSKDDDSDILFVEISDNEYWVLYRNDKLSVWGTAKYSVASLFKMFEEYKKVSGNNNLDVSENLEEPVKLTEKQKSELINLKSNKVDLEKKIDSVEKKLQNLNKELAKKEADFDKYKDDYSKLLMDYAQKACDNCKIELDLFTENLNDIKDKIRLFEIKTYSMVDISSEEALLGKNIVKLLFQVAFGSPEFRSILQAFRSDSPIYDPIKKELLVRLTYILRDSANFEENKEIFEYLIEMFVPKFKDDFRKIVKNNKNENTFFDAALEFFGIN